MADDDEEGTLPTDELNEIITPIVTGVLLDQLYDEKKVPLWINEICEKIMKSMIDLKCPYKYIVNCMITQKTANPICNGFSVNWENNADHIESFVYPSRTMQK